MNRIPYRPPTAAEVPRKTCGIRWAIWSGITCLFAAAMCALLTFVFIYSTFESLAPESASNPDDSAVGIRHAFVSGYGIMAFGVLGTILLIVGLAVRRPIDE